MVFSFSSCSFIALSIALLIISNKLGKSFFVVLIGCMVYFFLFGKIIISLGASFGNSILLKSLPYLALNFVVFSFF